MEKVGQTSVFHNRTCGNGPLYRESSGVELSGSPNGGRYQAGKGY
jgi:hypothetical protein